MTAENDCKSVCPIHKEPEIEEKRTNNYRKSDKTVSRTFDSTTHLMYYAFQLITV